MTGNKHLRKQRTRSHVLESLCANYLERLVFLNGFTCQYFNDDYGIDLNIYTYDPGGFYENGHIGIQLKATDNLDLVNEANEIAFTVDKRDIDYWLKYQMPVILIIYDGQKDNAYWLYIQRHFEQMLNFDLNLMPHNFTIRIPVTNCLTQSSIMEFRDFKISVIYQMNKNEISYV